jgi:NAD+ synthase (glutamine-hydrolysing)
MIEHYEPKESYLRVATACPEVSVADVTTNVENITAVYKAATAENISLLTLPELSVTGYTLGDLVQQTPLLEQAKIGLQTLAEVTENQETAMIVGLPLQVGSRLYNCAAILAKGKIQGIVPKTYRPNYNEFYEQRWYDTWQKPNTEITIGKETVTFGTDMLFEVGDVLCGIEICEDLWVSRPPSVELAAEGALVIANPSASPEQIGKAERRRNLVVTHSEKILGAYVYAGCDSSESTAEIVMGGHQIIASDGHMANEKLPFTDQDLTIADIDIDHLLSDRRRHHAANAIGTLIVKTGVIRQQEGLRLEVNRNPFLPEESDAARSERLESALQIQAYGLAMRMKSSKIERIVLGLSGGLDSTLALLVAHKAATILHKNPAEVIHTLTMPGPASSENTQSNAQLLAKELGVKNLVIPIEALVRVELEALDHDGTTQDITYENVQARARTNLLFNYANKNGTMVLGTGDLSEIALGWCTYNGDQQSHYNVNASIPKTLVRHLVQHVSKQSAYQSAQATLEAILGTTISPELTKADSDAISQSTEDLIGPYELHDFFLYHVVRWGDTPAKIAHLAEQAFSDDYSSSEIRKWFGVFADRFSKNQFKRENLPNGPKVGSVSLSPRGDWRMPPDLHNAAIWQ